MVKKVAILTAGGFAPCLSSAIGGLIQRYTEVAPGVEIIAYKHGYQGLLSDRQFAGQAHQHQGSRETRPGG